MDPRVQKLAHLLTHYSLGLKKGQLIKIQGERVVLPLIFAAYEEAIRIGAYPTVDILLPETDEMLLTHGSEDQLRYISPMGRVEVNKLDALLIIWGSQNTRYLSSVNPQQQATRQKSRRPFFSKVLKRISTGELHWVGTQFPTQANAQDAGMSLANYEDFVYRAGHIHAADPARHWLKVKKEQARLVKLLEQVDQIHIRAEDTDLRLRVGGRSWVSCHGDQNFPDGEVFTGPIENSVEGHIRYTFPAVYGGREVTDVRLEFKRGRVVSASAATNQDYLTAMLDMDKGARYVGEFAIGTNYDIKQFSKNTLFDEKIGGSCHLALGASLPESGGRNRSALHWDMICDLRSGGTITADGRTIHRDGRFII